MNIIFLSPNFPPNWVGFCKALKEAGANVLAIGDSSYDELRQEVKENISDYFQVTNMLNLDAMVRATGYFIHRCGRIKHIESLTEHWLGIEAELRRMFNIPGPTVEDQAISRSKMGMKKVFQKHKIPCSPGYLVNSQEDVESHLEEFGLPIVLKPDIGVGAQATYKIVSRSQLDEVARYGLSNYVMEPFVNGQIVTFDGLTDSTGEIVFKTSHEYNAGVMEIVTENLPIHFYSVRDINPKLEEMGRKVVAAFNLKERFFHIEFFKLAPEKYQILEINIRPPGGYIIDMMNYSADINLFAMWAEIMMGRSVEPHLERKYYVAHVARRYHFNYRYSYDEIMPIIKDSLVYSCEIPPIFSAAMGNFLYVIRHENRIELEELIAKIEERRG